MINSTIELQILLEALALKISLLLFLHIRGACQDPAEWNE